VTSFFRSEAANPI